MISRALMAYNERLKSGLPPVPVPAAFGASNPAQGAASKVTPAAPATTAQYLPRTTVTRGPPDDYVPRYTEADQVGGRNNEYFNRPIAPPNPGADNYLGGDKNFYNKFYKNYGYSLKARPYEYDASAFEDPNYAGNAAKLQAMQAFYGNRGAPTSQWQGDQAGLLSTLAGQYGQAASGQGPSIAEMSLNRAREGNIASAMALSRSQPGNPAAARTAAYNVTDINQDIAGQTAIARLQEVELARQGLAGVAGQYGQMSAQDVTAALQQQQLNDNMVAQFVAQGLSLDQAQVEARRQLEQMRGQQHMTAQQTLKGIGAGGGGGNTSAALGGALIGGAAAVGSAALMSDRKMKRKIVDSDGEIKDFLSAMKAYRYKYKKKVDPSDLDRFGIMAQDLEKTPAGKSLVLDMKTEDGKTFKAVDTTMAVGTLLAASAHLNDRLSKVEALKAFKGNE